MSNIPNSKIHSLLKGGGTEMNTFVNAADGLNPESILTLMVYTDELAQQN